MVYYNIKKNNLLLKFFSCLLLTIYIFMCLFGSYVCATIDTEYIENTSFHSSTWDLDFNVVLPNDVNNYEYCALFERNDSPSSSRPLYLLLSNTPIIATSSRSSTSNYIDFTYIEKYYCCYHSKTNKLYTSNTFNFTQKLSSGYDVTTSSVTTNVSFKFCESAEPIEVSTFFTYSNHNILDNQGNLVFQGSLSVKNPEVTTSISDLENLSANGISISANSWSEEDLYILFYNTSFNNSINDRTEPLQKFLLVPYLAQNIPNPFYDPTNSTSTNIQYYIPISNLGFPLSIGNTYEIRFATIESYVDPIDTNNYYNYYNFVGDPYSFTISNNVSQDTINNINQNIALETEKNYNEELNNSINNQTNSINNINNSITDTNIDTTFDLPSDTTQDITQNGINNIFTNIYNSFTSGTAQDIVFPIPFTDKNITLQANYIYRMLSSNGLSWVVSFIRAFWWYYIGRFIIKDVANKIKKIKSGDVENIENSNIRSDML